MNSLIFHKNTSDVSSPILLDSINKNINETKKIQFQTLHKLLLILNNQNGTDANLMKRVEVVTYKFRQLLVFVALRWLHRCSCIRS